MARSSASECMARLRAKSYWREEDGRLAVEMWRESGLPLATFAHQHGLRASRLSWWRDRLAPASEPMTVSTTAIVPVTVIGRGGAEPMKRSAGLMEIVLVSGHVVRIGVDFDADALIRLVHALEAVC